MRRGVPRPRFFKCWLGNKELQRWHEAARKAGAASLSGWVRGLVGQELKRLEGEEGLAKMRRQVLGGFGD